MRFLFAYLVTLGLFPVVLVHGLQYFYPSVWYEYIRESAYLTVTMYVVCSLWSKQREIEKEICERVKTDMKGALIQYASDVIALRITYTNQLSTIQHKLNVASDRILRIKNHRNFVLSQLEYLSIICKEMVSNMMIDHTTHSGLKEPPSDVTLQQMKRFCETLMVLKERSACTEWNSPPLKPFVLKSDSWNNPIVKHLSLGCHSI